MSLISDVNNFGSDVVNDLQNVISNAMNSIHNFFGDAVANLSSLFDGGFVGIDENGLETLQTAIKEYCDGVLEIVDGFNEDARISDAYKGVIAEAVKGFVAETKSLLKAYVSNVMRESVEAKQLFAAFRAGSENIQKDVQAGTDEIRKDASNIQFDMPTGGN